MYITFIFHDSGLKYDVIKLEFEVFLSVTAKTRPIINYNANQPARYLCKI
jgi:hypothetical protein